MDEHVPSADGGVELPAVEQTASVDTESVIPDLHASPVHNTEVDSAGVITDALAAPDQQATTEISEQSNDLQVDHVIDDTEDNVIYDRSVLKSWYVILRLVQGMVDVQLYRCSAGELLVQHGGWLNEPMQRPWR
ncbi:hypothetical protein V6N11_038905 [Hibiscus sabdariffa]|uniref:Uncharacterized protein n=1 Tax=Hibiscus sabdariffa TaxID=183260 RepID=A0ABR2SLP0_9ROSI